MDDECVEELGRPISSLKVSELRDELAKRALIKTGKKTELVDRLRQAISKQSSSSLQSAVNLSAEVVEPEATAQLDSAIDYSNPQADISDMASSQQQVSMPVSEVVDYSTTDRDIGDNSRLDVNSHNEIHENEEEEPPETQVHSEAEIIYNDHKQNTIEEQNVQKENERQIEHQPSVAEQNDDIGEQPNLKDGSPSLANTDQETKAEDQTDNVETESLDDSSKAEPESIVPVSFTLKRGNRDGSGSNKERRRKWSGKTPDQSQSSGSSIVSGGISSQKLQELIDLKQLDTSEVNKNASPKDAGLHNDEKSDELKLQAHENHAIETLEKAETNLDDKASIMQEKTNNDDRNESRHDIKSKLDETPVEEDKQVEPTNWLIIRNLMRPYTVTQLKEELTKFGPIVDEKFWTDKVKSKCCVLYESIDAAQQTKVAMQGQHWPLSNPKSLVVNFITEEQYKEHIAADTKPPPVKKPEDSSNKAINGGSSKSSKQTNNRLGDRLQTGEVSSSSLEQRLGGKLLTDTGEKKSSDLSKLDLVDLQPKELDELFRKTRANPQLFWLPLNEEQAEAKAVERKEREKRAREVISQNESRRSPPSKRRTQNQIRRSPARHRSPARRSPTRRRSPAPRRRTPPASSHRSPPRRRSPLTSRNPPPRRRSISREQSPLLRRRVSPKNSPPPIRRRSPKRDSPPPFRRRTPLRDTPPIRRRSPSPLLRRRTPPRDSPPIRRRSPEPGRRSPAAYIGRSPDMLRRSPGPGRRMSPGRRSPVMMRRSPNMIRRSPMRRSPGPMRRSPEPVRRSPLLMRRSPGPIRRSPVPVRRSPGPLRRSPVPTRRPRNNRDYYD